MEAQLIRHLMNPPAACCAFGSAMYLLVKFLDQSMDFQKVRPDDRSQYQSDYIICE